MIDCFSCPIVRPGSFCSHSTVTSTHRKSLVRPSAIASANWFVFVFAFCIFCVLLRDSFWFVSFFVVVRLQYSRERNRYLVARSNSINQYQSMNHSIAVCAMRAVHRRVRGAVWRSRHRRRQLAQSIISFESFDIAFVCWFVSFVLRSMFVFIESLYV